ncbi:hypothetical protein ACOME3_007575 [Neoechinorhynchus agilis]
MSELLNLMQKCIPRLTSKLYKGQCGRVAIIGGSEDYAGAPYFSAISSLKSGADYVRVVCPNSTAPIIKSYSPDLVVHPLLNAQNADLERLLQWINKSTSVVLGPGLGRDDQQLEFVAKILTNIYERMPKTTVVIDADEKHNTYSNEKENSDFWYCGGLKTFPEQSHDIVNVNEECAPRTLD